MRTLPARQKSCDLTPAVTDFNLTDLRLVPHDLSRFPTFMEVHISHTLLFSFANYSLENSVSPLHSTSSSIHDDPKNTMFNITEVGRSALVARTSQKLR
jgi:hypothetical protein